MERDSARCPLGSQKGSTFASGSARSEVEDEPEHRKADASERREIESSVDLHHELVGWATGTCLGVSCRTPDRSFTKRPETAPTDLPPTGYASWGSRTVPALAWAGVLGK